MSRLSLDAQLKDRELTQLDPYSHAVAHDVRRTAPATFIANTTHNPHASCRRLPAASILYTFTAFE